MTFLYSVFSQRSLIPKKGFFCFLAQLMAWILPSVPRTPKPPGTNTPLPSKHRHTTLLMEKICFQKLQLVLNTMSERLNTKWPIRKWKRHLAAEP